MQVAIDFQNVIEQRLIYLDRTVSITTLYTNVVTLYTLIE